MEKKAVLWGKRIENNWCFLTMGMAKNYKCVVEKKDIDHRNFGGSET